MDKQGHVDTEKYENICLDNTEDIPTDCQEYVPIYKSKEIHVRNMYVLLENNNQ